MKVTIATSIKYGNYKHLQPRANTLAWFVRKWKERLVKYIDFDLGVEIKIRPIRGSTITGQAILGKNKVDLDPRFTPREQCKTIIHELIHHEQVKQGRLEVGPQWKWNGVLHTESDSYEKYLDLPWEVEARARAEEIFPRVFGLIN